MTLRPVLLALALSACAPAQSESRSGVTPTGSASAAPTGSGTPALDADDPVAPSLEDAEPAIDLEAGWNWRTDPALATALSLSLQGKPDAASQEVAAVRAKTTDAAEIARLRYLEARLLKDAGKPTAALAAFLAIGATSSAVSDAALLRAVELHAALGEDRAAVEVARKIDRAVVSERAVSSVVALSAARTAPIAEVEAHLGRTFLDAAERKPGWAIDALRVLKSLAQRREPEAATLALALADVLAFDSPKGRGSEDAEKIVKQLEGRMSHDAREARKPTDATLADRADRMARAGQAKKAVTILDRLHKKHEKSPPDDATRCAVESARGRALGLVKRTGDAAEAYALAVDACDRSGTGAADLALLAGRAGFKVGRGAFAERVLLAFEDRKAARADEARLERVRKLLDGGPKQAAVEKLVRDAATTYPTSRSTRDAIFEWMLAALEAGDTDTAAAALALEAGLHDAPGFREERGYERAGRFRYYRGRLASRRGARAEALAELERTMKRFPLSFYGALAAAEVDRLEAGRAGTLFAKWLAEDPTVSVPGVPRARAEEPAVRAAIALASVGDSRGVETVLLGLRASEPEARAWPVVGGTLLRLAGDEQRAHAWLRGWREREPKATDPEPVAFLEELPRGSARSLYTTAFPRMFTDVVGAASLESGTPPALIFAVMREESAFLPRALSVADARGLLQVIPPTGAAMARNLGVKKFDKERLFEPELNVRIGSRYLKNLLGRFEPLSPLSIAGYNAGPGAPERWAGEKPGLEVDLFIERIPYAETRAYVKRVWSSYFAYQMLYEGDITPLLVTASHIPIPAADKAPPTDLPAAP